MDILESGIFRVEAPHSQETKNKVSPPNPICESLLGLFILFLFWLFVIWLCDFLATR